MADAVRNERDPCLVCLVGRPLVFEDIGEESRDGVLLTGLFGLLISGLSDSSDRNAGFALRLFSGAGLEVREGPFFLRLGAATVAGVLIRPSGVEFDSSLGAGISIGLQWPTTPQGNSTTYVGNANGTRVEFERLRVELSARALQSQNDLRLLLELRSVRLFLSLDDALLRSVLPSSRLEAAADVRLSFSNVDGLTLDGSASLCVRVGLNITLLGVVNIRSLDLRLSLTTTALSGIALLDVELSLGPLQLNVSGVGFGIGWLLCSADTGESSLTYGLVGPTGIGVSVNADVVIGAGLLRKMANRGLASVRSPTAHPVVVPPAYGSFAMGSAALAARIPGASSSWYNTLNLDLHARMAAGVATQVVQAQQQPLMASTASCSTATCSTSTPTRGGSAPGAVEHASTDPTTPPSSHDAAAPGWSNSSASRGSPTATLPLPR